MVAVCVNTLIPNQRGRTMIGDPFDKTQQSGRTMLLRKVFGYASYEHERYRGCAGWEINVQEDASRDSSAFSVSLITWAPELT